MRIVVALAVLGLAAGCGATPSPVTPSAPVVASPSASLSSSSSRVQVGRTQQITAVVTLGSGVVEANPKGTWTSDAPEVATVSDTGLVTAVGNGAATIRFDYPGAARASQRLTITGDFTAKWTGTYEIAECSETGDVSTQGFCASFATGLSGAFTLMTTQTDEAIEGSGFLAGLSHNTGRTSLSGPFLSDVALTTERPDNDLATSITWKLSQVSMSSVRGALDVTVTRPGLSGHGRFTGRITSIRRRASTDIVGITFYLPSQPRTFAELRQTLGLR
jgi:hypothetical protein